MSAFSPHAKRTDALASAERRRTRAERALIGLEVLLAIGAYGGALGLITGGVNLGEHTADLPFGSAAFGGWMLALVNGVLPTVVVVGAAARRPWAATGHLLVGIALVAWIVVQVAVLGFPIHWLQTLYLIWGLVIIALAWRLGHDQARRSASGVS